MLGHLEVAQRQQLKTLQQMEFCNVSGDEWRNNSVFGHHIQLVHQAPYWLHPENLWLVNLRQG